MHVLSNFTSVQTQQNIHVKILTISCNFICFFYFFCFSVPYTLLPSSFLCCSKFKQLCFFSPWHVGSRQREERREERIGWKEKKRWAKAEGNDCLVRTAYYWEHSNLRPLGRLPVTSNKMTWGSLETDAV